MRKMMKPVGLLRLVTQISLVIILSACDKSNPVNSNKPPCPDIVPTPPYNSPVWHPSGKFIGFNHTPLKRITFPYGEHCTAVYELNGDSSGFWLINPDGTNQRRIFSYQLQTPAWSPDGQWIAFVGNAQIYKMRFTGTTFDTATVVQLTFEGRNFFPAWSPNGQWIAYNKSICEGPNTCGIWLMSLSGQEHRFLAPFGNYPSWHFSGTKVLYATRSVTQSGQVLGDSLWLLDVNTNAKSLIIFLGGQNYYNRYPKYSPDGTKIAFWSSQPSSGSGNLWMMRGDGGNLRQLTTEGVDDGFGLSFSWSPDGSAIAYTYYRVDERSNNNGTLWIIDIATGKKRRLTLNQQATNLELSALRR
jgi:Tol biopolymer transport system component